ncbi:hypothetical protein CN204_04290 [Sinorhizobium meliloti]|uniref:hypothetical protein n=1 Tax=Rhizobium meliloti TaxID=382 RepID=UPI000FDCC6BB|nr:hypothetical protein [Sinorhizobium meliloti]RVH87757.1 hypothetical protein CN204_04290 [Sinorhizobium meliloti]
MSEIIERVAQVIHESQGYSTPWKTCTQCDAVARDVIEEIAFLISGLPTPRLIGTSDTDPGRVWDIAAIAQHRAIVDYLQAALKERA